MVDDSIELGSTDRASRANKTLEYSAHQPDFDKSWLGGGHVSYYDNGMTAPFRALETSTPSNIPLILGGVKNTYIGQKSLAPYLSAVKAGELVFIHSADIMIPVIIDKTPAVKTFGLITPEEWRGAGHDGIDSYNTRMGGKLGDAHTIEADRLSHTEAVLVNFHVANAQELKAHNVDPKVVADQVRSGRVALQSKHVTAEDEAIAFAIGKNATPDLIHSFEEATGLAIAAMRGREQGEGWSRTGPGGGGGG